MTTVFATPSLTPTLIESVIGALPIQGRIMLKLILLQHFDVTDEEINYMTADRPDPRCVAGTKPTYNILTQEAIKAVRDKRDEYRRHARLRRERTMLQCDCLKQLLKLRETLAERVPHLLKSRYDVAADVIAALQAQARTAVNKPQIRLLTERWEADEISADEFQRQRLGIEMQIQIRLADRYRKRLDLANRERHTSDYTPLLDHEIAQIWGLPAGTLAARKVKYMTQYLQSLHAALQGEQSPASSPPLDLWRETFAVLANRPVERSLSTYDGLEQTEAKLIDKLTMLAWGTLNEDIDTKFWNSLVQGGSSNAVLSEVTRNLFGLQRLAAILNDLDASPDNLDDELLRRTAPAAKASAGALEGPAKEESKPLTDIQQAILNNFRGEDAGSRGSDKW